MAGTTVTNSFIERAADVLRDPVEFVRVFLGGDVWDLQADILRSVQDHGMTSVKACHASGKTFIAAQAALHWLAKYNNGIVVTTAPTWNQVERLLWGEIHVAVSKSHWPFPDPHKTELKIGPQNYAIGLSTDEGDRFQGFHGQILIIVDEATGVRETIFHAIEGIRAGGEVRVLLLGNPTMAGGRFYDSFRVPSVNKITIDAFDTPNFRGVTEAQLQALPQTWEALTPEQREFLKDNERPYLITRRWVWEKINDWGVDSAIYQSRVRGKFPVEADDALYSMYDVERAGQEVEIGEPVEIGIDVAGPGEDETVLYVRRGGMTEPPRTWRLSDPRGAVAAECRKNPDALFKVDAVGLGHGMWRHLTDLGFRTSPIVAQEAATDRTRFANRKAEMYWDFRRQLREGEIGGVTDPETVAQLLSIRYTHTSNGRIAIVPKKDMRRQGVKSPDRAEALIMAHAAPATPPFRCY